MMNSSNPALILDPLALATGGSGGTSFSSSSRGRKLVKVHPLVLMSVLDHHTRRHENASRVIGTLLGQRTTTHGAGGSSMTVIHITNCFAVPHAEQGEEVAIGKDFNRQMLALHMRANRNDVVVGWYATALPPDSAGADTSGDADPQGYRCIADTSSLIHEFYAGESSSSRAAGTPSDAGSLWDPIHLVVDTSLTFDAIAVKAYQSTPVTIGDETFANMFHEIPVEVTSSESERICVAKMLEDSRKKSDKESLESSFDGIEGLEKSMEKLLELIDTVSEYVDEKVDSPSKTSPDDDVVGRKLYDALASVPRIREEVLEKIFHNKLHDLLMLSYLSQVTKTQVRLAEKLNETLTLGAA